MNWYSLFRYLGFYGQAVTKYQLHSPAVFKLVMATMEDPRMYYVFEEIPVMRKSLLRQSAHLNHPFQPIKKHILVNAPSRNSGERLFHLVKHFAPDKIYMLGSGASLGCLYAAAASQSELVIWENQPLMESITRLNMEVMRCDKRSSFHQGRLERLAQVTENDLVICFSDYQLHDPEILGHLFSGQPKAWVMMNMYASKERFQLLQTFRQHPKLRASADFFDFTVLLPNVRFREVLHLKVVPAWLKPWKFY